MSTFRFHALEKATSRKPVFVEELAKNLRFLVQMSLMTNQ